MILRECYIPKSVEKHQFDKSGQPSYLDVVQTGFYYTKISIKVEQKTPKVPFHRSFSK